MMPGNILLAAGILNIHPAITNKPAATAKRAVILVMEAELRLKKMNCGVTIISAVIFYRKLRNLTTKLFQLQVEAHAYTHKYTVRYNRSFAVKRIRIKFILY